MYSYFNEHFINDMYDKYSKFSIICEDESEYMYNRYHACDGNVVMVVEVGDDSNLQNSNLKNPDWWD